MKLHEYVSKRLLAKHGVPVPSGEVATTPEGAHRIARQLGTPVVVKSQVLVGGRGKAGGIRLAQTADEAETTARCLLGMEIGGLPVREVLVEEAVEIRQELYLGVVVDRALSRSVLMASSKGGVEIEHEARASPEAIRKIAVEPLLGLRGYQTLALAKSIGLARKHHRAFDDICRGLYGAFCACDAWLAEINPLVVTRDGELLAVDGKMILDDNGRFRHPELVPRRQQDEETPTERKAREAGLSYVQLDGDIGCIVNGAGLAMATMDVIKHFGGLPANFLDIGGGARAESVTTALHLILVATEIKSVLLNVFGGITRCDEVAEGIVAALQEAESNLPVIVRLVGTNEAEGRAILESSIFPVITATTLTDAAQKAVAAARSELSA